MAWLLDTHALLWVLFEAAQLGRRNRTILGFLSKDRSASFFKAHGLKTEW